MRPELSDCPFSSIVIPACFKRESSLGRSPDDTAAFSGMTRSRYESLNLGESQGRKVPDDAPASFARKCWKTWCAGRKGLTGASAGCASCLS